MEASKQVTMQARLQRKLSANRLRGRTPESGQWLALETDLNRMGFSDIAFLVLARFSSSVLCWTFPYFIPMVSKWSRGISNVT